MRLRLKVVKGKPQGQCLLFPHGQFLFGRGPECDVRTNSDLVSRQHCLLEVTDEHALIRDLGSTNGTLVFGQLVVGDRILVHGDTLQVGPLVLQVVLEQTGEEQDLAMGDTILIGSEDTKTHETEFKFDPARTNLG